MKVTGNKIVRVLAVSLFTFMSVIFAASAAEVTLSWFNEPTKPLGAGWTASSGQLSGITSFSGDDLVIEAEQASLLYTAPTAPAGDKIFEYQVAFGAAYASLADLPIDGVKAGLALVKDGNASKIAYVNDQGAWALSEITVDDPTAKVVIDIVKENASYKYEMIGADANVEIGSAPAAVAEISCAEFKGVGRLTSFIGEVYGTATTMIVSEDKATTNYYASVDAALAAVEATESIELIDNDTINAYPAAGTYSIVTAGHTLSLADGLNVRLTGSGTVTVQSAGSAAKFVASVSGLPTAGNADKFFAFGDALAEMSENGTLTLLQNITVSEGVTWGTAGTLALNGKTYTYSATSGGYQFTLTASMTITDTADGAIVKNATATMFKVQDGTSLTLDGGLLHQAVTVQDNTGSIVKVENGGTFTMNGGELRSALLDKNFAIGCNETGFATIKGGKVNGKVRDGGDYTAANVTVPALVNEALNPAKFLEDLTANIVPAEGYKMEKGEDEFYMVAREKSACTVTISLVNATATVNVDDEPIESGAVAYEGSVITVVDAVADEDYENPVVTIKGQETSTYTVQADDEEIVVMVVATKVAPTPEWFFGKIEEGWPTVEGMKGAWADNATTLATFENGALSLNSGSEALKFNPDDQHAFTNETLKVKTTLAFDAVAPSALPDAADMKGGVTVVDDDGVLSYYIIQAKSDGKANEWVTCAALGTPAGSSSVDVTVEFKSIEGAPCVRYMIGESATDWLKIFIADAADVKVTETGYIGTGTINALAGEIVISTTVAKIGDREFDSLDEAIEEVKPTETIELVADAVMTKAPAPGFYNIKKDGFKLTTAFVGVDYKFSTNDAGVTVFEFDEGGKFYAAIVGRSTEGNADKFFSLAAALAAMTKNETVQVLADQDVAAFTWATAGTLDLNGKVLTVAEAGINATATLTVGTEAGGTLNGALAGTVVIPANFGEALNTVKFIADYAAFLSPSEGYEMVKGSDEFYTVAVKLNKAIVTITKTHATATVKADGEPIESGAEVVEGTLLTVVDAMADEGYENLKVTINGVEATEYTTVAADTAIAIAVTAKKGSTTTAWFDGKIEEGWPTVDDMKGAWADNATTLATYGANKIDVNSGDAELVFTPEDQHSFKTDDLKVETEITFTEIDLGALNAIDLTGSKGGVAVVAKDDGSLAYYGVLSAGSANAWVELTALGEAKVEEPVTLMTELKTVGGVPSVRYIIGSLTNDWAAIVVGDDDVKVNAASYIGSGSVATLVGQYETVASEAEIDGVLYDTFDDAFLAATDGATIKLLQNVVWTPSTVSADVLKKFILDLNGKTFDDTGVKALFDAKGFKYGNTEANYEAKLPFASGDGTTAETAWEIADYETLRLFKNGVNAGSYGADTEARQFFKQTAEITVEADSWEGVGVKGGKMFTGTYDAENHVVSGVLLKKQDYSGFFAALDGATIRNIQVQVAGFAEGDATSYGAAGIAGISYNGSVIENATALAMADDAVLTGNHNMAGIIVRAENGITLTSCTNNLSVQSSYTKIGGMTTLVTAGGVFTFDGCVNNAKLIAAGSSGASGSTKAAGCDGLAGIVAYEQTEITVIISNCQSLGELMVDETAVGEVAGSEKPLVGSIIGRHTGSSKATFEISGNVAKAGYLSNGDGKAILGLNYATVEGDLATFVDGDVLVADQTYKVMSSIAAPSDELKLAKDETVAFDISLNAEFDATDKIVAADTATCEITSETSGNVVTFTCVEKEKVTLTVDVDAGVKLVALTNAQGKAVVLIDNKYTAIKEAAEVLTVGYELNANYKLADGCEVPETITLDDNKTLTITTVLQGISLAEKIPVVENATLKVEEITYEGETATTNDVTETKVVQPGADVRIVYTANEGYDISGETEFKFSNVTSADQVTVTAPTPTLKDFTFEVKVGDLISVVVTNGTEQMTPVEGQYKFTGKYFNVVTAYYSANEGYSPSMLTQTQKLTNGVEFLLVTAEVNQVTFAVPVGDNVEVVVSNKTTETILAQDTDEKYTANYWDEVVAFYTAPEGYTLSKTSQEKTITADVEFEKVTASFQTFTLSGIPAGIPGYGAVVSNATEGVTIDPDAGTTPGTSTYQIPYGAKIVVYFTANEGYRITAKSTYTIAEVKEDVELTDAELPTVEKIAKVEITPAEHVTFVAKVGDAEFDANPTNLVQGTEFTVTATPGEGYEFTNLPGGWALAETGDASTNMTVGTENEITIAIPEVEAKDFGFTVPVGEDHIEVVVTNAGVAMEPFDDNTYTGKYFDVVTAYYSAGEGYTPSMLTQTQKLTNGVEFLLVTAEVNQVTFTVPVGENVTVVVSNKTTDVILSKDTETEEYTANYWDEVVAFYTAPEGYTLSPAGPQEKTIKTDVEFTEVTATLQTFKLTGIQTGLPGYAAIVSNATDDVIIAPDEPGMPGGATYTIPYGAKIVVIFTANEGYVITENSTYTIDKVTGPVELTGSNLPTVKKIVKVEIMSADNVTFVAKVGEDEFDANPTNLLEGASFTVTATPNEGYEYAKAPTGWALSEAGVASTNVTVEKTDIAIAIPTVTLKDFGFTVPVGEDHIEVVVTNAGVAMKPFDDNTYTGKYFDVVTAYYSAGEGYTPSMATQEQKLTNGVEFLLVTAEVNQVTFTVPVGDYVTVAVTNTETNAEISPDTEGNYTANYWDKVLATYTPTGDYTLSPADPQEREIKPGVTFDKVTAFCRVDVPNGSGHHFVCKAYTNGYEITDGELVGIGATVKFVFTADDNYALRGNTTFEKSATANGVTVSSEERPAVKNIVEYTFEATKGSVAMALTTNGLAIAESEMDENGKIKLVEDDTWKLVVSPASGYSYNEVPDGWDDEGDGMISSNATVAATATTIVIPTPTKTGLVIVIPTEVVPNDLENPFTLAVTNKTIGGGLVSADEWGNYSANQGNTLGITYQIDDDYVLSKEGAEWSGPTLDYTVGSDVTQTVVKVTATKLWTVKVPEVANVTCKVFVGDDEITGNPIRVKHGTEVTFEFKANEGYMLASYEEVIEKSTMATSDETTVDVSDMPEVKTVIAIVNEGTDKLEWNATNVIDKLFDGYNYDDITATFVKKSADIATMPNCGYEFNANTVFTESWADELRTIAVTGDLVIDKDILPFSGENGAFTISGDLTLAKDLTVGDIDSESVYTLVFGGELLGDKKISLGGNKGIVKAKSGELPIEARGWVLVIDDPDGDDYYTYHTEGEFRGVVAVTIDGETKKYTDDDCEELEADILGLCTTDDAFVMIEVNDDIDLRNQSIFSAKYPAGTTLFVIGKGSDAVPPQMEIWPPEEDGELTQDSVAPNAWTLVFGDVALSNNVSAGDQVTAYEIVGKATIYGEVMIGSADEEEAAELWLDGEVAFDTDAKIVLNKNGTLYAATVIEEGRVTAAEGGKIVKVESAYLGMTVYMWADVKAVQVAPGGEGITVEAASQNEADAIAACSIVMPANDEVLSFLSQNHLLAEYQALFICKATDKGDGTYAIKSAFDPDVETAITAIINKACNELVANFRQKKSGTIQIKSEPGLYYTMKQGPTMYSLTPNASVLGTGGLITLPFDATQPSQFYEIEVTFNPID